MNVPEKHRAVAHAWVDGAEVECTPRGLSEWRYRTLPMWAEDYEYRVKPTKPSIDWSHVYVSHNYLALDEDRMPYLYAVRPEVNNIVNAWGGWGTKPIPATVFQSYKTGNCDWRDSLIVRPGYEENES